MDRKYKVGASKAGTISYALKITRKRNKIKKLIVGIRK